MAKRVFKNKRLMRSILILAGFLIVGFFLWTMLFKNTKIFEGQTTGQAPDPAAPVDAASTACIDAKRADSVPVFRACMMQNLVTNNKNMTQVAFNNATANATTQNAISEKLRDHFRTQPQPTAASVTPEATAQFSAVTDSPTQPFPVDSTAA